jgi:hypothetical protein
MGSHRPHFSEEWDHRSGFVGRNLAFDENLDRHNGTSPLHWGASMRSAAMEGF